jgi:hypothetical protein
MQLAPVSQRHLPSRNSSFYSISATCNVQQWQRRDDRAFPVQQQPCPRSLNQPSASMFGIIIRSSSDEAVGVHSAQLQLRLRCCVQQQQHSRVSVSAVVSDSVTPARVRWQQRYRTAVEAVSSSARDLCFGGDLAKATAAAFICTCAARGGFNAV